MPEPPCIEGTHWRVLKEPIPVAPSQLRALEQLLIQRVDPSTCQRPSTAGKVTGGNRIAVNRPLQTNSPAHRLVYCECADWTSKSAKDAAYCQLTPDRRGVYRFSG
jgi:Eukaryotic-type carbonic anhydrase